VLATVRKMVGRNCPIVATIDLHANVSETMAECADVLVGYDTYPHTDMAARGAEAVTVLCRLLEGETLHRAHIKLPLLTAPQSQATDEEPTRSVMAALAEVERRPGIVTASIAMGFAYADCADLGASVLVHGVDPDAVARAAEDLASALWARRAEFRPALLPPDRIAAAIGTDALTPVVLLDPADNVGGGSAGDGTVILAELLRCGAEDAAIVMYDPQAAAIAAAAGIGGRFEGLVGGKTDDAHGAPVEVAGEVVFAGDASFRHSGSYMTGFVTRMGITAVVRAGGVRIVLTSLRTMPFDIEQLRCVGIEPAGQRVIVAKSAIAWRSAFGAVAGSVFTIDAPGVATSNLERVPYRHRPRPLYPLEPETTFCEGAPT
jgi:microcystin degradation protein MlrC